MANKLMAAAPSAPAPTSPSNALTGGALPGNPDGSEQMTGGPQPHQGAPGMPGGQGMNVDALTDAMTKQAQIDAMMRSTLATQGGPDRKNVVDMAVGIVEQGLLPAAKMAEILTDLPKDKLDIQKWLQQHATTIEQGINKASAMLYGSTRQQSKGPMQ